MSVSPPAADWRFAGSFREKTILLVAYVGIIALSRGITEILLAFRLKGLRRRFAAA